MLAIYVENSYNLNIWSTHFPAISKTFAIKNDHFKGCKKPLSKLISVTFVKRKKDAKLSRWPSPSFSYEEVSRVPPLQRACIKSCIIYNYYIKICMTRLNSTFFPLYACVQFFEQMLARVYVNPQRRWHKMR